MKESHDGFTANMSPEHVAKWTAEIIAWEELIETLQPKNLKSPYDSDEAGTDILYICNAERLQEIV